MDAPSAERPKHKKAGRFVPDACMDSRHLAFYEGVIRDCVHAIKYQENRGLGEFFSKRLSILVKEAGWPIDIVIPVPLSRQRLKERGYNQSGLIARPLAARLRIACNAYGLARTLDTPSQVGLSAEERHKNVIGAFTASREIVQSKDVLLVDDVMTTGSTLGACAHALMAAGAQGVYAVTIGQHKAWTHASSLNIHQV